VQGGSYITSGNGIAISGTRGKASIMGAIARSATNWHRDGGPRWSPRQLSAAMRAASSTQRQRRTRKGTMARRGRHERSRTHARLPRPPAVRPLFDVGRATCAPVARGRAGEYVHVCIDDASRIAFSQVMNNERKECAVAFPRRPSPNM
jgi:hypothetical protein